MVLGCWSAVCLGCGRAGGCVVVGLWGPGRGGSGVAGAGGLAGFLDRVAVVPGAFGRAGAAAVPAFGIGSFGDLGQDVGQGGVPVLRGERPPSRWRYGGPVVACG